MTTHGSNDKHWRECAAGYALRALDAGDSSEFQSHLQDCATCRAEVAALREVVGEIGLVAAPVAPPPALWNRIANNLEFSAASHQHESLQTQPWKQPVEQQRSGELLYVPGSDSGWEPTAVPGVRFRRLFTDEQNDRITMLVQMDPGASYPAHVHATPEECYVIKGDLIVGDNDLVMGAGDYQRAAGGSRHQRQWTKNGCTLLIVSSLHDELDELTR